MIQPAIQPAAPSHLHAGRASANAGAMRAGAGAAGSPTFASLFGGGGGDGDGEGDRQVAAASPAADRQDDAADGTTMPPPMMAMDASWLSLVLPDPLVGSAAPDPAAVPRPAASVPSSAVIAPPTATPAPSIDTAAVVAANPGAVPAPAPRPAAFSTPVQSVAATVSTAVRPVDADPPSHSGPVPVASASPVVADEQTPAPLTAIMGSDRPAIAGDRGAGGKIDATAVYDTPASDAPIALARPADLPIGSGGSIDRRAAVHAAAAAAAGAIVRPMAARIDPAAPTPVRGEPRPAYRTTSSTIEPAGGPRALAMPLVDTSLPAAMPMVADAAVLPDPIAPAPMVAAEPLATSPGRASPPSDARATGPLVAPALPLVAPPAGTVPPASAAAAPAGEVFAAAIHAAGRPWREDREADGASAQQAIAAAAPIASVAAAGAREDATLDMRHGGWPGAMVDHIERLRDAADATDTRIRLVPDALGSIDVSLARRDDGVQVTLTADRPATQAMLAEARPQLTDLAQARGLRLADAGLGAGAGGGAQGFADHRRQPAPATVPAAPASATTTTDDRDPAGSRVA